MVCNNKEIIINITIPNDACPEFLMEGIANDTWEKLFNQLSQISMFKVVAPMCLNNKEQKQDFIKKFKEHCIARNKEIENKTMNFNGKKIRVVGSDITTFKFNFFDYVVESFENLPAELLIEEDLIKDEPCKVFKTPESEEKYVFFNKSKTIVSYKTIQRFGNTVLFRGSEHDITILDLPTQQVKELFDKCTFIFEDFNFCGKTYRKLRSGSQEKYKAYLLDEQFDTISELELPPNSNSSMDNFKTILLQPQIMKVLSKEFRKNPESFQNLETKYFDKQHKKTLKMFLNEIKTGLKERISKDPTDEDIAIAHNILVKTVEKIAAEKQNIKEQIKNAKLEKKKDKANKKAIKVMQKNIDKELDI